MRTSCLLLVGLGSGVIGLSTSGCGGKLTNAETLEDQRDGSVITGTTTGSDTTGTGGDNTGGAGGNGATGGGSGGTSDPDPTGSGGSTSGTTGTGATTGTGGSGTGGSGTGGSGASNPGGSGGTGGGGSTPDASSGCPDTQPNNNSTCSEPSTCSYGTTDCTCMMSGGGGNRADAGRFTWSCSGGGTGGRGGRG